MPQSLPRTQPLRYSLAWWRLPQATSHKPQATSHKPQATSHKPQATSHKPQATSHKPQATSHKPQATSHKPQAGLRPRSPADPSDSLDSFAARTVASARSALLRLQPNLLPVLLGVFLLGLVAPAAAQTRLADGSYEVSRNWALKPSGLQLGDKFRVLFVTSTGRNARSPNIADYNTFVQNRAKAGHTAIRPYSAQFKVVGSTNTVHARDNTGTTGTGVPIYWLNGDKVADNYGDFYDGSWDSLARKNENGSNGPTGRVWTGSKNDGTKHNLHLGRLAHVNPAILWSVQFAGSGKTLFTSDSLFVQTAAFNYNYSLYGLSPVFTVEDDRVQMENVKLNIAEFGNHEANGGVRFSVKIGDGAKLAGRDRTINYTVSGTATRGDGKDYTIAGCTSSSCSVKLPANSYSSQSITIYVNNDGLDENDETIVFTLKGGNGYTVNKDKKTTTVTILDDDTRGLTFHRRWADVKEGSSATNTVRLSSQPTAAVTVNIASNNPDVTVNPTSLTFNPSGNTKLWSRTQQVTVSAAQDNDAVDDEATLTYTTSGGDYGGAKALSIDRPVSVDDDDTTTTTGPQLPRISLTGGAAVTEGSPAIFTVNADPAPTARLTVNVEVIEPDGQNFVAASQEGVRTVVLNAGATSTTFTVPTVNDTTDEDDGDVRVFVNDGTGYVAREGAAVTVRDNDNPIPRAYFGSASSSAAENAGTQTVTVNLTRPAPSGGLTLRYSISGTATAGSGNDFTIQNSGTVSVSAGATSATIAVAINDDSATENAETVILTLASGTGYTVGSPSVHTLTITDNDSTAAQPSVSFASASSSVAEDAGTPNVTVNISPAPSGGLTLRYSVAGTATAGSGNDFTIQNSGTVSVSAGATSATIPVAINDDGATESAETVILTLTGGTGYTVGAPSVHTLTISDNDSSGQPSASFAAGSSSAAENAGTRNVRVNLSSAAPSGGLTLSYTLSGNATRGTDYTISGVTSNTGTLAVAGNANSANIPVAILDDSTQESAETVILTLTGGTGYTVGAPSVHTLTISDNDSSGQPSASFAAGSSSAAENAGTRNVRVNLSSAAPSGGLTLSYTLSGNATRGTDYTISGVTSNTGTLAVAGNANSANIPVAILDDSTQESAETVILTLTDGEGYTLGETQVHTLTITDNDTAGLRASPTTVHLAEAGEQATVSVHLTAQPTAPVTVTFASSQGRVATVTPATLRFTPATWQTPQPVTITAGADGVSTLRGTVQSHDRGYAALASGGALPHIRVRVGADLTGLTTPWLARFGRTVTSQAVTGVTARLAAARTPGLTGTVAGLALDRMGEAAAPATTQVAPATQLALAPADPRLNPGGQHLNLRDILAGSAFALTSDPSATGGSYALWGQGAWTRFAGQAGAQDVEGNVLSGTLGVDWAQGAWVLGVAVSHTQGDGDAAQTTAQGDLASSLTLVTPYVGVDVTEQLSLWGTMGYGRGTVGLTLPTEPEVETDLSLFLVAGGVRERLLEPTSTGGLAVAVRSEARFLRTMADADTAQGLAESEADVGLLRVGLESSWQQPLADGGAVVPRLDVGFRQDLGEAETGLGLEVQGGVRWEAPAHGLTLDVAGQTLLAHSDQEFETWGGSATVQWAANPNSAAGPALTLRQTYGGAGPGAGANTFWTENPVALLQAPGPAELRLTADFGWGVPLQAGLGVPHVRYGWGPTSRDIALGWRLLPTRATAMTLELTATHREAVRTAPAQGVALSLTRQW